MGTEMGPIRGYKKGVWRGDVDDLLNSCLVLVGSGKKLIKKCQNHCNPLSNGYPKLGRKWAKKGSKRGQNRGPKKGRLREDCHRNSKNTNQNKSIFVLRGSNH